MEVYFELADVFGAEVVTTQPLMRLCLALEENLPAIPERQVKTIECLCDIAVKDKNCFFMSEDTWLKMTISLKNPKSFFDKQFSRDELMKRITNGSDILQQNVERAPDITIRRSVLPRQEYWEKLQEFHHRSLLAREFYSLRILKEAFCERKPLTEKLKERRKSGGQCCELAISLQPSDVPDAVPSNHQEVQGERPTNPELVLHAVNSTEVFMSRKLGQGGRGIVWQVVWGSCTYALKFFDMEEGSFTTEYEFAKSGLVSHRNIVQAFGYSRQYLMEEYRREADWQPGDHLRPCLLMELLDGTLERFLYQSSTKLDPPISRVEKFDVLLQIASAMRKLHQNNVMHGDLKLANILLNEFEVSGDVRHFLAKVTDFDNAIKFSTSESFEPNGGGTTEYASPELLRRRVDRRVRVNRKSDIYSFGVVAYEILTENWAYDGIKLDTKKKRREVYEGKKKLIDCTAWRELKNSRLHFKYFKEVIPIVESCLELRPDPRPEFSQICNVLITSKSNLQDLVRSCFSSLPSYFLLLCEHWWHANFWRHQAP